MNEVDLGLKTALGLNLEIEEWGPAEVRRRVGGVASALDPTVPRAVVRWTPGRSTVLEAAPRLRLTPELSLGARYRFFARAQDRYETVDPGAPPATVLLPFAAVRTHHLGAEIGYSTVEAHRAGETPVPFLVRLRIDRAVAGRGGRVPAGTRVEGGFRVFFSP